jgi:hypothetical protein
MKTLVIFFLLGALLGAAVASVIVPPTLAWYASPGGLPKGAQMQVIVQMPEIIRYATSKLIVGQAIGAGIGAVVCFALGLVLASKRRKAAVAV